MTEIIKIFYTVVTILSVSLSSIFYPAQLLPESQNFEFSFLEYPENAVLTLDEAGLTEYEFTQRASAELEEYVQSGGYNDVGDIIISPYYSAEIFRY